MNKVHAFSLSVQMMVLLACMISVCTSVFTPITLPNSPSAAKTIAVSSSGRYLVIADTNAQYIRVLDMNNPSAWLVSAGTGNAGYLDNTSPTSSIFNNPFGVAILENNNGPLAIYVADSTNNCIRKITWATWAVIVFSGLCQTNGGKADGLQLAARYNNPKGIATVGNDTAYIADNGNSIIRKLVVSTATVTTLTTPFSNPAVPPIYIAGVSASASSTVLWVSVGTTSGSSSGLVKITLSGSSESSVTVFNSYGGGGVAVSPPDSNGVSWVYVASSTLAGSLRTVNASNTAIYANSTNVVTTVVLGMAVNGTTTDASVLALANYGNQVGVLSGISTAPTGGGAPKPHTKTLSSSQPPSSRTQSSSKDITATRSHPTTTFTYSSTYSTSIIGTSPTKTATPTASGFLFSSTLSRHSPLSPTTTLLPRTSTLPSRRHHTKTMVPTWLPAP
ncbi:membrane-associated protein, putative, partial [Bodo saltans]